MDLRDLDVECLILIGSETFAIDEGPWDGSASNYTDEQYARACVLDRKSCGGKWADAPVKSRCSLPIKTPSGELSRRGTHAAAGRLNQVTDACTGAIDSAKSQLRSAYKQLGEKPPPSIGGDSEKNKGLIDEVDILTTALIEPAGHIWCIRKEAMDVVSELYDRMISSAAMEPWVTQTEVRIDNAGPRDAGGGIAVIPLQGIITPRPSLISMIFGGGDGSLSTFRRSLAQATADPGVDKIVLNVNSPGGLVDHVPETAKDIRAARSVKPIVAVANTTAGSAAYWLAAQAHEVIVTDSGEVGSIGAYTVHKDLSEAAKKAGIKYTIISAGKYKTETNPWEPLGEPAQAHLQEKANDHFNTFVNDVAKGRGVTPAAAEGGYGEGRMYLAHRAVRAGMADRVATLQETVKRLSHPQSKVKGYHSEIEEGGDGDLQPTVSAEDLEKAHAQSVAEAELLFV